MGFFTTTDPLCVARFTGDPAVPLRVAELILEMLAEPRGQRLPEELRASASVALFLVHGIGSPAAAHYASVTQFLVEGGLVELAVSEIEATRHAGLDYMSVRDGLLAGAPGNMAWVLMAGVMPAFLKTQPPEAVQALRERFVSSGLFRLSLEAMSHFANRGTEAVTDGNHIALYFLLKIPNFCRSLPGCEGQIRARAPALAFCMDNNLLAIRSMHGTSAQAACQLAANVFGRDDDSDLAFSTEHVHELMGFWTRIVNAVGTHKMFPPSAEYLSVHIMCKSDDNKDKLLAHHEFLPMLISGLLLTEDHPRLPLAEPIHSWCQAMHAECLMQLAVFPPGKAALLQSPEAMERLEMLADVGLTNEAKDFARGALVALRDADQPHALGGNVMDEHIMLSYQWDVQPTIVRLNGSLQQRGYKTWLDLECMKGSVMDAMSDAIDGAAVVLFAVSLAYKESANCRLEAQYAMQSDKNMIPLMVQKDYKAKGWLGLVLGARLWHSFWDADKDDNESFEKRVDTLVAELGARGKQLPGKATIPAPGPTVAPSPAPSAASVAHSAPADQAKAVQKKRAQALSGGTGHDDAPQSQQSPAHAAAVSTTFAELLAILNQRESLIEARLEREKTAVIQAQRRVSAEQIDALQHRLHSLLETGMLEEETFCACEDTIADNVQAMALGSAATDELVRIVALSERFATDVSLARQLRRKFSHGSSLATAQSQVGGL